MNRTFRLLLLIALTALSLPTRDHANTIRVPDDQETIQNGINAALNGDTVLVGEGRYEENINFSGRSITVASRFLTEGNEEFIASTVIDGGWNNHSAVVFRAGERATLTGFTITGALTDYGGGVYCRASSPTLSHLVITGNATTRSGAGVYATQFSTLTMDYVTVTDDSAGYLAGGVGIFGGTSATLTHCLIAGNSADHVGGGLYAYNSTLNVRAVTVASNIARHNGGALYLTQSAQATLTDVIFIDDLPHEIYVAPVGMAPARLTVRFSDIEGGRDGIITWPPAEVDWWANIDEDPLFTDAGNGDYSLQDGSPCIDGGNPESPDDPDGTRADVGAFYFNNEDGQKVLRVPEPYAAIQDALAESEDGDIVLVFPGEYVENLSFPGTAITVGSREITTGDLVYRDSTVIDGSQDGSTIRFNRGEDMTTSLVGFTITGGLGDLGGGIYLAGASPEIRDCIVIANEARETGGGIYCISAAPTIEDCLIFGNEARGGGGLFCSAEASRPTLRGSVIASNVAAMAAGVYAYSGSQPAFINCTIVSNLAENEGGALRLADGSSATLENCILWTNDPEAVLFSAEGTPNAVAVSYCDVEGGVDNIITNDNGDVDWGDGNIDADPLFVDPENADYHLAENSPCINTGDPESPNDPDSTRTDIGAYYFDNPVQREAMTLHVPDDYGTIQGAINLSIDGDTVLVAPGRYQENINYNGRNITVASHYLLDGDPAFIDSTIIDGGGAGSVVTFNRREGGNAKLIGFQITGGADEEGGGIHIMEASPTIERCIIHGNTAENGGAAVFCYTGSPQFTNCTIAANECAEGGGILLWAEASVILTNCILWGNEPTQVFFGADRERNMIAINYSDIQDGEGGIVTNNNGDVVWGDGNLDDDPLFVDYDARDFHLQEGSPCIDMGDPDSHADLDETPADMGALPYLLYYPIIVIDPNPSEFDYYYFGAVGVGASREWVLTITNEGLGGVTFAEPYVEYVEGEGFTVEWWGELELEGRGHDTLFVGVTFTPDTVQDYVGQLILSTNLPDEPPIQVELRGAGVEGGVELASPIPDIVLNEDPGLTEIADLDTVFADLGGGGLSYNVEGAAELNLAITEAGILTLNPNLNWSGSDLEIIVTADDGQGRNLLAGGRVLRSVEGFSEPRSLRSVNDRTLHQPNRPSRDGATSDTFLVTILPLNDPPVIVDALGNEAPPSINIPVQENEELSLTFYAEDVEDAASDLRWILAERDGLPNGYQFTDHRNGSATFAWTPDYNASRPVPYTPLFYAIDTSDSIDALRVNITVGNINRPPVVAQRISDVDINEDPNPRRIIITDLDDVFTDPDQGEDDDLAFNFYNAPREMHMLRDHENVLTINPDLNYFTPDPVAIVVTAQDPHDSTTADTFTVTINGVNDPPTTFELYAPSDSAVVEQNYWMVRFDWGEATDVDQDDLTYNLWLQFRYGAVDTVIFRGAFVQTDFTLTRLDSIMRKLGVAAGDEERRTSIDWWVTVSDYDTTIESDEHRALIVRVPSSVNERWQGLPDEFTLEPPFPNPFNSVTRIQYGLPKPAAVRLTIHDAGGRLAAVLESAKLQKAAGWHSAVWSANGLPAGVYIVILDAGNVTRMTKVVLVR